MFLVACRVTSVAAFGFFAPKVWDVVGTYKWPFCLKMNAALAVLTM